MCSVTPIPKLCFKFCMNDDYASFFIAVFCVCLVIGFALFVG